MDVRFNLIREDAIAPTKAYDSDAGFDLSVPENYLPSIHYYDGNKETFVVTEETKNKEFARFASLIQQGLAVGNIAYISYKFGISIDTPEGIFWQMCPRSSLSGLPIILANSIGIIDQGYTGELEARFKVVSIHGLDKLKTYRKVCQLVPIIQPKLEWSIVRRQITSVAEDSVQPDVSKRGKKGFGSSDKL